MLGDPIEHLSLATRSRLYKNRQTNAILSWAVSWLDQIF